MLRSENRLKIDNVEVKDWAASDTNGVTDLIVNESKKAGATTIMPDRAKLAASTLILEEVPTRRVADWWGNGEISLFKLDVEGAEFLVLSAQKESSN